MSNRLLPQVALLVVLTSSLCSCSSIFRRPAEQTKSEELPSSATPPFQTREPETYQAERIITTTDARGLSLTSSTAIARSGDMRRELIRNGVTKPIVILEIGARRLVIVSDDNVYAEVNGEEGDVVEDLVELGTSPERLLYQQPIATTYQKLGTEVIGGRTTAKYRVVVNTSTAASVSKGETFVWIDETLGMPIKSETKVDDGSQTLMELKNISLGVDKNIFEMPQGCKKVTAAELRQRIANN